MSNLPSGTVTFLFTDIEGSTQLWEQHPEAMQVALAKHDSILKAAIESNNGRSIKTTGDGVHAVFESALDGVLAVVTAQRSFQIEAWGETGPLKVRMGLHTGEAEARAGDYFGPTLNRAARLMSVGAGGQILLSAATASLIQIQLPSGIELRDLGEHRLKDLIRPEHIYQVVAAGLPADFPTLKSLSALPNNLPVQLTSFIGREKEMREVKQLLGNNRLTTLVGPGGTGKTRLSLQVAADLLDSFSDGVWFIELAPLADPALVPQTVAASLGLREEAGRPVLQTLAEFLKTRRALLILDNCEHLVEACAQLAEALLHACPNLKIMASSREALGIAGEAPYRVPSLSIPDARHPPPLETLTQYEAVQLFIERARTALPTFAVTNDNALAVAQVCHRLDGIPLALELAAARVKVLRVEQIAQRLDDRFRLLTGGSRTALPRQQTLRALIDWSWELLSDSERGLLRRLSVFAGGWVLESAEAVCAGDGIEDYAVLDLLTQLANKSLVTVEREQGAETRYRLLETIRQYAREKLLEAGGSESVRQRHLACFVELAEEAEPELYRSNQLRWFNRLEDELDNFRMAFEWALATDVEAGLRMAAAPWRFWEARGHFQEVREWLAQLLEQHTPLDILHTQALAIYSFAIFRKGDLPETIRVAEQSLHMARALSDKPSEALSLSFLGGVTLLQGNVSVGFPFLEQSLTLYRELGNKIGQANVLERLSFSNADLKRAIAYAQESLALYRELGNLTGIGSILMGLARLTCWSGDFSSPAAWLEEALAISRQLDDQTTEEAALIAYGNMVYWQGNYPLAIAYYEEATKVSEKIGDQFQNLWAQVHRAYATLRQGDIQKAHTLFETSIQNMHKAGLMIGLVFAIEGVASLCITQGQHERATRLFAWADTMRDTIGDHRPPVEQASVEKDLAVIHSRVDDAEFAKCSAEGRAMTLEQAIELALLESA